MKPEWEGKCPGWHAPLSHHIITIYYINLCAQRVNGVMAGKGFLDPLFLDPLLLGLKVTSKKEE